MRAVSIIAGASFVIAVAITQKLWRTLTFVLLPSLIVAGYIRHGFASKIHQYPLWYLFSITLFYILVLFFTSAIGGVYAYFAKFKNENIEEFYEKIRVSIREAA